MACKAQVVPDLGLRALGLGFGAPENLVDVKISKGC